MTKAARGTPALLWEMGTGYELFISLTVLHGPEYYGVRASWAAGIRSRIPAPERKFLEEVVPFLPFPLGWVHNLPEPRDSISALWALRQILRREGCPCSWISTPGSMRRSRRSGSASPKRTGGKKAT